MPGDIGKTNDSFVQVIIAASKNLALTITGNRASPLQQKPFFPYHGYGVSSRTYYCNQYVFSTKRIIGSTSIWSPPPVRLQQWSIRKSSLFYSWVLGSSILLHNNSPTWTSRQWLRWCKASWKRKWSISLQLSYKMDLTDLSSLNTSSAQLEG